MRNKMHRKNIYQPAEARRVMEEADPHDKVVLRALKNAAPIGRAAGLLETESELLLSTVLEYPLPGDSGYADIAVFIGGELVFLMEVKSKAEAQSASAWVRQVRVYEKAADVPTLLVISHDLGPVQTEYLGVADVSVFDLREIEGRK